MPPARRRAHQSGPSDLTKRAARITGKPPGQPRRSAATAMERCSDPPEDRAETKPVRTRAAYQTLVGGRGFVTKSRKHLTQTSPMPDETRMTREQTK